MAVTVFQLKAMLADLPDSMLIVMQSDDEGNSYKYLRGIEGESEGDKANYFHSEEHACYRGLDRESLEEYGIDLNELGLAVAVLY